MVLAIVAVVLLVALLVAICAFWYEMGRRSGYAEGFDDATL